VAEMFKGLTSDVSDGISAAAEKKNGKWDL